MSDQHTTSDTLNSKELLEIVELITSKLNCGESLDVEKLIHDNPNHVSQLRDLVPTLEAISLLALQPQSSGVDSAIVSDSTLPALSRGQLGEFRIVRELGRGGMGIVYEAEQQSLSRRVALKVFPFASILDSRQLRRFHNESQAAALLKHPNIVGVHSVGCELGVHFYAMELVEGQSLAQLLSTVREEGGFRGKPLDAASLRHESDPTLDTVPAGKFSTEFSSRRHGYHRSIVAITIQVAEALHYAHGEGIVHRDIKPANLMIDRDGKPWITDFGLARIRTNTELTMSGDLLGTLRYMSPEQAMGRSIVDERSDIYSLGVTLYELLTLRPAFDQSGRAALIHAVIEQSPPKPRQCDSSIPADLETIVLKAINKSADNRYANCQEFAEDLRRFRERKPIAARRASRTEHVWRWSRRNPIPAALTLLVAFLLLTVALGGSVVAIRQTRQANELKEAIYDAQMGVAHAALENDEIQRVDGILRAYIPREGETDLRGFEWFHLWHECRRAFRPMVLQDDWPVHCVDFSRDGRFFAAAGYGGTISLRIAKSFEPVWQYRNDFTKKTPRVGPIDTIAFSRDGKLLATGGRDSALRIWNAETGDLLLEQNYSPTFVSALAFCSEPNVLAAGFGQPESAPNEPTRIEMWSISRKSTVDRERVELTPLRVLTQPVGRVHAIAFSVGGSYLAAGSNSGQIHLLDLATNEVLPSLSVDGDVVSDIAFSPTRNDVLGAVSGSSDTSQQAVRMISLWNIRERRELHRFWEATSGAKKVAFSPDGEWLASAGYGREVKLWDLKSYRLSGSLGRHAGTVMDVEFSTDGSTVATASTDNTVKLWQTEDQMRNDQFRGHDGAVLGLAVSKDSQVLLSASLDATARLWDANTGMHLNTIATDLGELMAAAISPDGRTLALGGGRYHQDSERVELFLWDVVREKRLHTLWSSTGKEAGTSLIYSAAFSPLGRRVAASIGRSVKIWDVASGTLVQDLSDAHQVARLAWSPCDDIIASATTHDELRLWNAATGELRVPLDSPLTNPLAVAFSPDGETLAVGGTSDGGIGLFDVYAGRHLRDLAGHSDKVFGLDFSPDGRRLASSSRASVKIWNLKTGRDVLTFDEPSSISWSVKFTPDGSALFATDTQVRDARIYVWRAAAPEAVRRDTEKPDHQYRLFQD